MTPDAFLAEVAHPNMVATFSGSDDMRTIVNAVLSLDALVGMIYTAGVASVRPEITAYREDRCYREALAVVSPSYRLLRDVAASLKHGELTNPKNTGLARLVRSSDALTVEASTLGFMECGDAMGGDIILVRYEHDQGAAKKVQGLARASRIVTDTYRMLKRIVDGGPAATDEHDAGTFALMDGPPGNARS